MSARVILVCGGRKYADKAKVQRWLAEYRPDCVVQGGATGADALAKEWAKKNGVAMVEVPANWSVYDLGAGSIRNGWMLDYVKVTMVLAFPGGRGTADMVRKARSAGIDVVQVG